MQCLGWIYTERVFAVHQKFPCFYLRNLAAHMCSTGLSHMHMLTHTHTLLALFLGIGYLVYLCIVIKMGTRKSQIKGKLHGRSLVHTLKILG